MRYSGFNEMLKFNAENYPDKTAVIYDDDGYKKKVSYKKLFTVITKRADEFRKLSYNCIGIYENSGIKYVVDTFASVIAGKQTVLLDANLPEIAVKSLINYADISYLCTDDDTEEIARKIKLSHVPVAENSGEGDLLFFTSGTTGLAKAVVLTSESLCASAWNGQDKLPCGHDDTLLSVLPLGHVFGFVCSLLWPMSQGATVAFGRGLRYIPLDPKYFNPTIISLVPSVLYFMLANGALNKKLRVILVGAGPANEQSLATAKAQGYEVHFGYGLTETSSGVAISTGENPFLMEVCHDDQISLGDDGEILIKAPTCMMKGYYKLPQDTDEVLKDGVLYTGDIGVFDNGYLKIIGRKKEILVLDNGEKIYLPEWEEELKRALGVEDVAIVMKNGITAICVDTKHTQSPTELNKKLIAFNRTKPFNKQINKIELRPIALPKTAVGKTKRWQI